MDRRANFTERSDSHKVVNVRPDSPSRGAIGSPGAASSPQAPEVVDMPPPVPVKPEAYGTPLLPPPLPMTKLASEREVGNRFNREAKIPIAGAPPPPMHDHVWGLPRRKFWIIVVVLVLVIAAALGAGLGGGLAAQRNNSPSPAPTPALGSDAAATSSTSSAATPSFSTGCMARDEQTYTPKDPANSNKPYTVSGVDFTFKVYCIKNLASKTGSSNTWITELQRIFNLTSLDDCMAQCAEYSTRVPGADPSANVPLNLDDMCSHVVYDVQENHKGSICFLQSGDTSNATSVGPSHEIDSAVFQWPFP